MALETHDLALALRALEAADGNASTTLSTAGYETVLLRLPVGQRHEHHASAPEVVLVLEGVGTVAVDDWRATLAGGILVGVPKGARLLVTADAVQSLSLLVVRAPPPLDAKPGSA